MKTAISIIIGLVIVLGIFWGVSFVIKNLPKSPVYVCDKWEDVYYARNLGWVDSISRIGVVSLDEAKSMAGSKSVLSKTNECTQSHWE